MDRAFGIAALAGFILSVIIHVSAVLQINAALVLSPFVWILHLGIFIVFIPFVISCYQTAVKISAAAGRPAMTGAGRAYFPLSAIRAVFPAWTLVIGGLLYVYIMVNFAIFTSSTGGGSPIFEGGKYLLQSHGTLIREITEAEYNGFLMNQVRGFSGHWLAFYFVPFAYFLFRKKSVPAPAAGLAAGST
jgi:hypothetical protein